MNDPSDHERESEILEADLQASPAAVLRQPVTHLIEATTGILSAKKEDLIRSLGFILQRSISGRFWEAFGEEWKKYKEEGRVRDDYESTKQCRECLQQLLDFLEKEDLPDEERFNILKKIFLIAGTEKVTDRDSVLPVQYMKICRTLSSGEVLVLNAAYRHTWQSTASGEIKVRDWRKPIAEISGLAHVHLVAAHEKGLVDKDLLFPIIPERGRTGLVSLGKHFRLTDLGYAICVYIDRDNN